MLYHSSHSLETVNALRNSDANCFAVSTGVLLSPIVLTQAVPTITPFCHLRWATPALAGGAREAACSIHESPAGFHELRQDFSPPNHCKALLKLFANSLAVSTGLSLPPIAFTHAEPTMTPSASAPTCLACSGVLMPNPTQTGTDVCLLT